MTANLSVGRVLEAIRTARLVAIVRSADRGQAYPAARRLIASGAQVIEISLTTPDAWATLERLTGEVSDSQVQVGAGTVLTSQQARRAAQLGAHFLLSPALDMSVMDAAADQGVLAIPGCATPTEINQATKGGAAVLKIFPARQWSPQALGDLLQAMPSLRCVPTGGIVPASGPDWLAAGAFAVGMGSALTAMSPSDQSHAIRVLRSAAVPGQGRGGS